MSSVNDSDSTLIDILDTTINNNASIPNYEVLPLFNSLHDVDAEKLVSEHPSNHSMWIRHASKLKASDVEILQSFSFWRDLYTNSYIVLSLVWVLLAMSVNLK